MLHFQNALRRTATSCLLCTINNARRCNTHFPGKTILFNDVNHMEIFRRSLKTQSTGSRMKVFDNVPEGFQLVYLSSVRKHLNWCHFIVLFSTSFAAYMAIQKLYNHFILGVKTNARRQTMFFGILEGTDVSACVLGFGFAVFYTVIWLQYALKAPICIYRKCNDFIIVSNGLLGPLRTKHTKLKAGELRQTTSKLARLNMTTIEGEGQKWYIIENNFRSNIDYIDLCGIDDWVYENKTYKRKL